MKKLTKNFKTACIKFNSKAKQLEKEMTLIQFSA